MGYDGENISFRDVTDDVRAQEIPRSSAGDVPPVEFINTQALRETAESTGKTFVDNPFDGSSKLKPDVVYVSGEFGYLYETDYLGRIEIIDNDIIKIDELCRVHGRDMPTEMKLVYNVKRNSLVAKYKYDLMYSNDPEKTADDIANEWFDEISNSPMDI